MKVKLELDIIEVNVLLNSLVAVAKSSPIGVLAQGIVNKLDITVKEAEKEMQNGNA